ncbi:YsnF/AvaK domain-containing protein [Olivibacter sp. XZL3]|uniref:YsnF/AvaK domain-containing protein n=1 Tax=Olivibacter sp. XZL3 TaxID=1735116 RepID=UPI0010671401|nr:YsnF/AvaK domain-containing protein [Olivibacter sp. XZL3]
MSHTVIGVFQYTSEAQEAKKYLLANGFTEANIDIATNYSQAGEEPERDEDFFDKMGDFFTNLFGDKEEDVARYTEASRNGTVVTVHAMSADEAEVAGRVLDNYGAVDVNEYAEKYRGATTDTSTDLAGSASIPVIEEEMHVGKQEVETGGVRLRSTIINRPVEESIRLRREHVIVDRTPVDRPATEADFKTFQEGSIEITEHEEVPVVSKEARVVEEVNLKKEVEEKEETIRDSVRKTDVEAEPIGNESRLNTDRNL